MRYLCLLFLFSTIAMGQTVWPNNSGYWFQPTSGTNWHWQYSGMRVKSQVPGDCGDTIFFDLGYYFPQGNSPWNCNTWIGRSDVPIYLMNRSGASINTTDGPSFGDLINLNDAGRYDIAYVKECVSGSQGVGVVLDRFLPPYYSGPYTTLNWVIEDDFVKIDSTFGINASWYKLSTGFIKVNKFLLSGDINATNFLGTANWGFGNWSGWGDVYPGLSAIDFSDSCDIQAYHFPDTSEFAGRKGLGAAAIPASKANGRGKAFNGGGGGNGFLAGGGGGGNGGAGGQGGNTAINCSMDSVGGIGGAELPLDPYRVFMGGYGGSGQLDTMLQNRLNYQDIQLSGHGGGIFILDCDTLIGNGGTIRLNGRHGYSSLLQHGPNGAGGGGAGGTVILRYKTLIGFVFVEAKGGIGGNNHTGITGPGGGGGGGIVYYPNSQYADNSQGLLAIDVSGGRGGRTLAYTLRHGSEDGADGRTDSTVPYFDWTYYNYPDETSFLGPDQSICSGDSLWLVSPLPHNTTNRWSDNSQGDSLLITQAGMYWQERTIGSCTYYDTIFIDTLPHGPRAILGPDRFLCPGDSIALSSSLVGEYRWNNNSRDSLIWVRDTGWYSLEVGLEHGCSVYDSVLISPDDFYKHAISKDTALCKGDSIRWGYPGYYTLNWADGSDNNFRYLKDTGWYEISIWNENSCFRIDSLHLRYKPIDSITPLESIDSTICEGKSLRVDFSDAQGEILWSDGSDDKRRSIYDTGWTVFSYIGSCFELQDSIHLSFVDCDTCSFIMPNAFSPNGDGLNDYYRIKSACAFESYDLIIYNRWGQVLFSGKQPEQAWDGRFNGEFCPSGIYIYRLRYKLPFKDFEERSGSLYIRH